MSDPKQDREIERQRYNARAEQTLAAAPLIGIDGAAGVDLPLRQPYLIYEQHIRSCVSPGTQVLDLCCGDGRHSLTAAHCGAIVTVSDIAASGLAVAAQRARRAGLEVKLLVADAESVPLPDSSFDVITCAGSLSYVDLERFLREVTRLLRPGGSFVFVDSLNHNPIYRFNRYLHYLRGHRTRQTLQRMPTLATVNRLRQVFPDLQVSTHGILSFLAPILRPVGTARATRWLDGFDTSAPDCIQRYAFKVVGCGRLGCK